VEKPWQYREKFQAMLEVDADDDKPGFRGAVRGAETVLQMAIENRGGVTISRKRLH
jgi:hypothetical protein